MNQNSSFVERIKLFRWILQHLINYTYALTTKKAKWNMQKRYRMAQSISFSNWNIQGIFLLINFTFVTWKWENKRFTHRVRNSKWNFLFTNRDLVTRKQNNKSLIFKLVTWGENKCFSTCFSTSSNSKVKQKGSTIELVTRSNFFLFFDFELVTWM